MDMETGMDTCIDKDMDTCIDKDMDMDMDMDMDIMLIKKQWSNLMPLCTSMKQTSTRAA
jgi:hypothetical protein